MTYTCTYVQTQKENKQNFKISQNALKLIKELEYRGGRLLRSCKVQVQCLNFWINRILNFYVEFSTISRNYGKQTYWALHTHTHTRTSVTTKYSIWKITLHVLQNYRTAAKLYTQKIQFVPCI